MTLRSKRLEWEKQENLIEIARETLKQEQEKAKLDFSLTEFYKKCDNIHASFLFQPSWERVLTTLCLKICSFEQTLPGGWMDFSAHLGFDKDLIDSVKNGNVNFTKDKAYFILKKFAKEDSATMDKIFKALENMGRFDILRILSPLVTELCNATYSYQTYSKDGGYSSEENNSRSIIKPVRCKDTILLNSLNTIITSEVQSNSFTLGTEASQKSQQVSCQREIKNSDNGPKVHSKVVMLTFAEDGESIAKELACALRNSFDKNRRSIGVVVLGENKSLIMDDPCIKIADCFNQVDFIISIITKKYEDQVFTSAENCDAFTASPAMQPDVFYAPFIFRLMATEYTRQHCVNTRFRSVIPYEQSRGFSFSNSRIMNIPFLSPWCLSKDAIEYPRKALLLGKKRN